MARTLGRVRYIQKLFSRSIDTNHSQANFRQTNVATKLKITYVKDKFLDVNSFSIYQVIALIVSQVKIQFRACKSRENNRQGR